MAARRYVTRAATPLVNALADGLLSSVGDTAADSVRELTTISVIVNQISAPVLNRHASLAMLSITTHIDTVVQAVAVGVGGQAFTVAIVMDAGAKAGTVALVGSAYAFHLDPGVSQVSDFETLVASTANLSVKTAGTAATLIQVGDAHGATNLTGGTSAGTFTVVLEKSADGLNYVSVATLTEANFATGYVNDAVETTLSDANGMGLRTRQIRATLTALESTTKLSLEIAGEEAYGW